MMNTKRREYALYKGDTFITFGTLQQLAKIAGVKPNSLIGHSSEKERLAKGQNAYIVVRVDDD